MWTGCTGLRLFPAEEGEIMSQRQSYMSTISKESNSHKVHGKKKKGKNEKKMTAKTDF